jgi:hypothetical protein
MAYTGQTWVDNDPSKPLSAARMQHIEDGLTAAANSGSTTVLYVDPVNGADANSGQTWGAAKKTIAGALAASATNVKIYLAGGTYTVTGLIDCTGTNIHIVGAGRGVTIIQGTGGVTIDAIFGSTGAVNKITIESLTIQGAALDTITLPTRARTYSGTQINTGIKFAGSLVPGSSNPVIQNVLVRDVECIGTTSLPVYLQGITGYAKVTESRFYNTMDVGWTYCQKAICTNNESFKSADNGFSLSRGNLSVTCTGNTVDLCCYWGIWVSGFVITGSNTNESGPVDFSVVGNTVTNAGAVGIKADDGPQRGVIAGNLVDKAYRGPTDGPSNLMGIGVAVGGYPSSVRATPTVFAQDVLVVANTLANCDLGGVQVAGAKNVTVRANHIVNAGSQFMADGTTPVSSSDAGQNFGVGAMIGAETTVTNLSIRNNAMVDTRGTPFMNSPYYTSSTVTPDVSNNYAVGGRIAVTTNDNTNDSYAGTKLFTGNTKFSGGATAGANSASGTVTGFDINGAAASTRPFRVMTAGVERWHMRGNSTAEGGSNAGTDWELRARSDAGADLGAALTVTRSDLHAVWGAAVQKPKITETYSTSITPNAATGHWRQITVTDGVAFTINAPTNPPDSTHTQEFTIEVFNNFGVMGAITWNAAFVFQGETWTNPASGKKRFARFEWNGAKWVCIRVATADY